MRTWPAINVQRPTEPELLQAALSDYAVTAIHEDPNGCWRVFFGTAEERDRAAIALPQDFPGIQIDVVNVADEDWASRSQAELRAVRVGQLIVAPPWDAPDAATLTAASGAGARVRRPLVIVIQPSMGFGTGHHATTRLCLAALQQFDLKGRTVMDVGTGSGVLAIAASVLGAARVIAIDDDPDAVQSARENAARNGATIDFRVADFRTLVLSRFDLVLANLTGALLTASARKLQDLASRRGPVILSGFGPAEEPSVMAAYHRLRVVDRSQEDEWVCLTLQHEGAFE